MLSSLEPAGNGAFKANESKNGAQIYKKCQNYLKQSACNWMIPAGTPSGPNMEEYCVSCRLNQTIPDLSRPQNQPLWVRMEIAKRRLIYTLLNFNLPVVSKADDPGQGLAFAFLEDQIKPDGKISRVMTGHKNGLITLNIAEADDSFREKARAALGEPFRTLLGHFRHEIGHYYWDRLVRGSSFLDRYRELFGNEEGNYDQALKQYYSLGPPANWRDSYISAYAAAHPWEDWAECWAHFMHIQDTLEIANHFGLVSKSIRLDPKNADGEVGPAPEQSKFEGIIGAWAGLTIALNSINRCMGISDTYPFVLSPGATIKLRFIFEVISAGAAKSATLR